MTADTPVVRFAPSPSGELHLGHAYSALFTESKARELGARLILRIEDIDLLRCRPAFTDAILRDLDWLGLTWEEPVRIQSGHMDDYRSALARLDAMGVLYPCFATRGDIARAIEGKPDHPRDPDGSPVYPGLSKSLSPEERERRIAAGEPHALRIDMARALEAVAAKMSLPLAFRELGTGPAGETGAVEADLAAWGDVVIARKDIGTSYHIAVVTDDALQGVTHVTRGQDLFHATAIHRLLQVLLDLPEPVYMHHGLVRDDTGRRLSKTARDRSLRALREAGVTAQDIRRKFGLG